MNKLTESNLYWALDRMIRCRRHPMIEARKYGFEERADQLCCEIDALLALAHHFGIYEGLPTTELENAERKYVELGKTSMMK